MKNKRRWIHEQILLSAYLDNELNPAERKQLEGRLGREPNLSEQFENLRKTKIILGHLVPLKAPRNFTLTSEMVPNRRKKSKPLVTFLRVASSFAAILLVLLVSMELVLGGNFADRVPLMAEAPVMEADTIVDEPTAEPLILWNDSDRSGAGRKSEAEGFGGGPGIEIESVEEPVTEEQTPVIEETLEPQIMSEEMAQDESPEEALSLEPDDADEAPILGLNPDEAGEILSKSEPLVQEKGVFSNWRGAIRWIQIALAAVALGGGILLWLLRRK